MAKSNVIEKTIRTKKEFNYSRPNGDVTLSFWLYVDDTHQLTEYLKMLKMAQADIEELLKEAKN